MDEVAQDFGLSLVWGKNFDCPIWMYFKAVGNFASWFNVPRSYEKRYTFYVYLDAALHYSKVPYKIAMVGSAATGLTVGHATGKH
uniref:Uncharacterized protein n=1 Tax=Moorena producens (strain JHB) TaxID=1454205 RepID=A0A1D9FZQ7_MOOP1